MESKGKLLLVRIPTVSLTKSSYFVAPSQTASLHTKPDGDNFDDEFICISDVEWNGPRDLSSNGQTRASAVPIAMAVAWLGSAS